MRFTSSSAVPSSAAALTMTHPRWCSPTPARTVIAPLRRGRIGPGAENRSVRYSSRLLAVAPKGTHEQRVLALKRVVETAFADPQLSGQLLRRRSGVTLPPEQVHRPVDGRRPPQTASVYPWEKRNLHDIVLQGQKLLMRPIPGPLPPYQEGIPLSAQLLSAHVPSATTVRTRVPLNTLAIPLGLAGLAQVWTVATSALGLPFELGQAFWLIAAIAWIWTLAVHVHRGTAHRSTAHSSAHALRSGSACGIASHRRDAARSRPFTARFRLPEPC